MVNCILFSLVVKEQTMNKASDIGRYLGIHLLNFCLFVQRNHHFVSSFVWMGSILKYDIFQFLFCFQHIFEIWAKYMQKINMKKGERTCSLGKGMTLNICWNCEGNFWTIKSHVGQKFALIGKCWLIFFDFSIYLLCWQMIDCPFISPQSERSELGDFLFLQEL